MPGDLGHEAPPRGDLSERRQPAFHSALDDGTRVLFRLIRPDDKKMLLAAFHRLSPDSRYERFFSHLKTLSQDQLRYLTEVDHQHHSAWVAIADREDGPEGIAVGRWVRLSENPEIAEVALTVVDAWHRKGLGRTLLSLCAATAHDRGVRYFRALVLSDNKATLAMLAHMGAADKHWESGVLEMTIPLDEAAGRTDLVPLRLVPADEVPDRSQGW